jgi:hypothetical protein
MLIGQPQTLDDFPALTPQQAQYLALPIVQALQSGHPLDVGVQVDFGVLCQLLATVKRFGEQIEALSTPMPVLRPEGVQEPVVVVSETAG